MREALFLIRHGWPPDTAFELDDVTRAAFCIALTEQNGGRFNWQAMRFDDDD